MSIPEQVKDAVEEKLGEFKGEIRERVTRMEAAVQRLAAQPEHLTDRLLLAMVGHRRTWAITWGSVIGWGAVAFTVGYLVGRY